MTVVYLATFCTSFKFQCGVSLWEISMGWCALAYRLMSEETWHNFMLSSNESRGLGRLCRCRKVHFNLNFCPLADEMKLS